MKLIIIIALAIFFLVDSLVRSFRSNINFGTILLYCITLGLWVDVFFHAQIEVFCAQGIGKFFKYAFYAGLVFLACLIAFLAFCINTPLSNGSENVLVVLGAGLRGDKVSGVLQRRLDAAFAYYEQNKEVLIVVSGGQGPQEAVPEAQAMAKYLQEKGVPKAQILQEGKSTSTQENFSFSKALLAQHGVAPDTAIAFVTNRFHCYRAAQYARVAGFSGASAVPAPTGSASWLTCYLREAFAVLYFWVFI